MGAVNRILITGAGGYLGRYTVAAARTQGLKVRALVRHERSRAPDWLQDDDIEVVITDLAEPGASLMHTLQGVDAVIHIAASLTGDDRAHARDTIRATQNLYNAIAAKPVPVVLAGSIGVYQGRAGRIDEHSPLEPNPDARDAYTRAKLGQERIADEATDQDISTYILRLGAIYGPGRLWNGHIGMRLGPVLIRLAGRGELPLCFAPHAALALVRAAEKPLPAAAVETLNVVDDNLPDARRYLAAIGTQDRPRLTLPLPWRALMPFARIARALRLPVPGLLRPATLLARMAPRSFDNTRAKAALGWQPSTPFTVALAEGGRP